MAAPLTEGRADCRPDSHLFGSPALLSRLQDYQRFRCAGIFGVKAISLVRLQLDRFDMIPSPRDGEACKMRRGIDIKSLPAEDRVIAAHN